MYNLRQQNTSGYPINFLMISSQDNITPITGITPNIYLSKNGGNFVAASGTTAEIQYGWYKFSPSANDLNTLGELIIRASGLYSDIYETRYTIVPFNPFDSVRLGLTALPNATAGSSSGLSINNLSIDARVNDPSAASGSFIADNSLSSIDNFYNNSALVFTDGSLKGIARKINTYNGSTRTLGFSTPFPTNPTNNDQFLIIGLIE